MGSACLPRERCEFVCTCLFRAISVGAGRQSLCTAVSAKEEEDVEGPSHQT